jgi:hypothetical protein
MEAADRIKRIKELTKKLSEELSHLEDELSVGSVIFKKIKLDSRIKDQLKNLVKGDPKNG